MSKREKVAFITAVMLSVLYAVLSGFGIGGIESVSGGLLYHLIIITVLLFSCSRVFSGDVIKQGGAVLTGALGLGALAVFEVFSFAYIYLHGGEHFDITISSYTRNCAYLFFLVAIIYLTPPVFKTYKTIRLVTGVLVSCFVTVIFFAVIIDNYILLAYSTIAIKIICILAATILFGKAKKGSPERLFSIAVRVICLLETGEQLLILYGNIWNLRDIIISFYPAVYLFTGYALIHMRYAGLTVPGNPLENAGVSGTHPSNGDNYE